MVHISQWWTARDCALVARAINKALGVFYQPDPEGGPWK
jgi:hypothetical protein